MTQISGPTLPAPKAHKFAELHGLTKEAEQIDKMVERQKDNWSQFKNRQTDVRRGYFIELFRQHGLFEKFKKECWPRGNGKEGEDNCRRYRTAKASFDEAVGGPLLSFSSHKPSTNQKAAPPTEEVSATKVSTPSPVSIESPPAEDQSAERTLIEDLAEIDHRNIETTTKSTLVDTRIGQGWFRTEVLKRWEHCCAVTGSSTREAIRASHILPWRDSTDEERLDPNNGLPLIASLDALFDTGLISFDSSGRLLVATKLTESERKIFGLDTRALLKKPSEKTATYLARHRQKHGFGE